MIVSRSRFGQVAVGLALAVGAAACGSGGVGAGGAAPTVASEHWDAPAYVAALADAEAAADQARHQPREPVGPAGPKPSVPPADAFGDDPTLDELWSQCEQGNGRSCDQLFQDAPRGSKYEAFGLSCGGRPDILHCNELDAPPAPPPAPTTTTIAVVTSD
jgi:hypothetical protein